MAGPRGNYHTEIRFSREQIQTLKVALSVAEHESQISEESYRELMALLGGPVNDEWTAMEKAAYERDAFIAADFYFDVIAPTEDAIEEGFKSSIVLMTKWEYARKDPHQMTSEEYFRPPWPFDIEIEYWVDGFWDTTTKPEEAIQSLASAGFERKEGLAEKLIVYSRTGVFE